MSTAKVNVQVNRNIPRVQNFSTLPAAAASLGEFYWCLESQGTKWLPGSMGGTYYPKGLYYSDGIGWSHQEIPFEASLAEVNAGTVQDRFVAPYTLQRSDLAVRFIWTIEFDGETQIDLTAPRNLKIEAVDVIVGATTVNIDVNGTTYTLGNPINQADQITITVIADSVINLDIEKI